MTDKIRIAIAGVGNCASSLIQGIEHYAGVGLKKSDRSLGLMHYVLGGYRASDIEVVCAFDIDARKVGRPLSEAIFAKPNCTKVFKQRIKSSPVKVQMAEVLDGVASHMADYPPDKRFVVSDKKPCDVADILKKSKADILMNYLPVGSEKATEFYAEACLNAGVAFINCVPVFIASNKKWEKRFALAGLPVIGDDVKSQIGATIVHRALTKLFADRGVKLDSTYQLNVGGNTDFLNMLQRSRLTSKKISKTQAVRSQMCEPIEDDRIHIGPADYIPWLGDNKVCFLRMEGRGFGNIPVNLELRLSVEDSPNSSGVVIDAIRCCKIAMDRGIGGALISPSSYFMKRPPQQFSDEEAKRMVGEFITGERKR
ncbi:MAG: inositol-3-phosphate synthase [Thermodesulfovibrionales bacterium]|nr:inositol-3-phosphate synthase [Thermodesulfovibrionales bacterium]